MSKNSKKKFVLLLFFLMVVTLIPAIGLPVGATAKPKLTKKLASIVIGETSKIKIKNIPKGAKITYKSSKKSIATVSKKGKVKGVKSGNAKITISIKKNSKVAKLFYKVTVQRPKLSKRILSLVIGETTKLYIENKPKLAKYIWTSNNTEIATVDEKGIVMAKSNGVATIKSEIKTAKATYYLQCRIIITKPKHTLQKYVVTFNSNGGSAVSSQTVMENSKAMKPARPSRSGYVFDGWYTDINGGTLFDFSTRIKGNITLYAHWNKIYNETPTPEDTIHDEKPTIKDMLNVENPVENEVVFENFAADVSDILVNQETTVTFTAEISSQDYLKENEITVFSKDGEKVTNLNDNGEGADITARDGLFTGTAELLAKKRGAEVYYAAYKDILSKEYEIFYYTELTNKDWKEISKVIENIETYNNVNDIYKYLKESDIIENTKISNDRSSIIYRTKSGITGIWEEQRGEKTIKSEASFDTLGNLTNSSSNMTYSDIYMELANSTLATTNDKKNICVVRPFHSSQFLYDDFSVVGDILADALNSDKNNYDDTSANIDVLKSFGDYGVVLLDTHGALSNVTNAAWTVFDTDPYILTSENYTAWESLTSADWECERVVVISTSDNILGGMFGGGIVAVGSKFFDKYYKTDSLTGSMFFLGSCYSMYNNKIAQSLLNKGAEVVYGFSDKVDTRYCNDVLFELILNQLLLKKQRAADAYLKTQLTCGKVDPYALSNEVITELQMLGDSNYTLVDSKGTVSGSVYSYDSGETIGHAIIKIKDKDGNIVKRLRCNKDGKFSQKLMAGTYTIEISAYGYITESVKDVVVTTQHITYLENSLLLHSVESTKISGKIINALTGEPIPNATIRFRVSHNNIIGDLITYLSGETVTITSDKNGNYEFDCLPSGYYTMEVSCAGFVTTTKNIISTEYAANQNVTLTPMINNATLRIILTWGENPVDLDSHLIGPMADGDNFHIYYEDEECWEEGKKMADLDVDDTTSYGPETTTVYYMLDGKYHFYIHRYDGFGSISTSNAQVKVYLGNDLIATYNAPTDQGMGDYWDVFELDGITKQITSINKILDEENY